MKIKEEYQCGWRRGSLWAGSGVLGEKALAEVLSFALLGASCFDLLEESRDGVENVLGVVEVSAALIAFDPQLGVFNNEIGQLAAEFLVIGSQLGVLGSMAAI